MIFLSVYELREADILNCHLNKHGKMLHGHSACSLNTVIKTEPGILRIMEVFFINTPVYFDHNSYGNGTLLCNTTTLFSVTEKSPLMVTTDLC